MTVFYPPRAAALMTARVPLNVSTAVSACMIKAKRAHFEQEDSLAQTRHSRKTSSIHNSSVIEFSVKKLQTTKKRGLLCVEKKLCPIL